jgi:glycosyltransferase involved in cell wall biosynthesis
MIKMGRTSPGVSVVIPCYNNGDRVATAIESALKQTYDPMEVTVVNDGSTDNSAEVIAEYEDRITYVETENHGAGHARNEGLRRSTGPYVKFLDADDELYPDALRQQVNQTTALSEPTHVVFGDAQYVRPNGSVSRETNFSNETFENRLLRVLKWNLQTSLPLHQRSYLEAVGGFDDSLPRAQEYDLHFRLAIHGVRFTYRPARVTRILQHDEPDRISNQDHFSRHPRGRLERIRSRTEAAQEANLLNDALRIHFARASWHAGRMALRRGFTDIADEYFELARSLHDDHVASTSIVYRWIAKGIEPHTAEWLVDRARSLQSLYSLS